MKKYDIEKTKILLKEKLLKSNDKRAEKRFIHSLGVCCAALELREKFYPFLDENVVEFTALIHDYAKFSTLDEYKNIIKKYNLPEEILEENSKVFHALLGCYIAKDELLIEDEEIVNAIKYHASGNKEMKPLEEIIYLADYIEKNRTSNECFDNVRKLANNSIKEAIALEAQYVLENLRAKDEKIHINAYETFDGYKKYLRRN